MSLPSRDFLGAPDALRSRAPSPRPAPATLLDASGSEYKAKRDASRSHFGRHSTRPPASTILERIRRRPKLVGGALLVLAALTIAWIALGVSDYIVLVRFKLRDMSFEEGWTNGCGLRKRPLLFIRGDAELAVVWETNCEQEFAVRVGAEGPAAGDVAVVAWEVKAKRVRVSDDSNTHWAYHAILKDLHGGSTYSYQIVLRDAPPTSRPLASHSFPWLGSSTSIAASAVGDNQYNVRTFHRILLRLLSHSRTRPKLLIHLGDVVQNPQNLAQWQTDFFDPMTSLLGYPLGQSTLILLARGNHDWDATGRNVYTGGSPPRTEWVRHLGRTAKTTSPHPGTYFSYSPHPRCRILILDANLESEEQGEQEQWLEWELRRSEGKRASLRIVMVHVPPFLEYWDQKAWTESGESQWCVRASLMTSEADLRTHRSLFVRHRLTPLLSLHGTHLVISGHQHAYSRGFLPAALHHSFTSAPNSSALSPFAIASTAERGWEKTPAAQREPGTIYAIIGGAGGTLDEDLVEQWGFYEKSVKGRYHFVGLELEFETMRAKERKGVRLYRVGERDRCKEGETAVVDALGWKAVGVEGKVFDEFRIEAEGCR